MLIRAIMQASRPTEHTRGRAATNAVRMRPTVAIDIPSGLDPDTGEPAEFCVKAILTLTLGLPKQGLVAERTRPYVGELKVLDIGFPRELLGR